MERSQAPKRTFSIPLKIPNFVFFIANTTCTTPYGLNSLLRITWKVVQFKSHNLSVHEVRSCNIFGHLLSVLVWKNLVKSWTFFESVVNVGSKKSSWTSICQHFVGWPHYKTNDVHDFDISYFLYIKLK